MNYHVTSYQGRNPNWEREELILALDLYFDANPRQTSDLDPRVINLSKILKILNIPRKTKNLENFRNPNSVYMKMCNFLALDPAYSGIGLKCGSKLDKIVWDEFASNQSLLKKTAIEILNANKIYSDIKTSNELNREKNRKIIHDVINSIKTSEKN